MLTPPSYAIVTALVVYWHEYYVVIRQAERTVSLLMSPSRADACVRGHMLFSSLLPSFRLRRHRCETALLNSHAAIEVAFFFAHAIAVAYYLLLQRRHHHH